MRGLVALWVSTHSRPKAAALVLPSNVWLQQFQHTAARRRLGFQTTLSGRAARFNTQPPEGGCIRVSCFNRCDCRFNTQPPEGGWAMAALMTDNPSVSTHSRPKAAEILELLVEIIKEFQHTAARRRLRCKIRHTPTVTLFQHTAARRRLLLFYRRRYGKK